VQAAADGRKRVLFDISMAERLNVEPASLDKLAGKYKCLDDDGVICTFFVRNGSLWYNEEFGKKLDPYGRTMQYLGNNTFGNPTAPPPIVHTYVFEISDNGSVKATETFVNSQGKKFVLVFEKLK
jgi:catechol 1,2-dioxygenase